MLSLKGGVGKTTVTLGLAGAAMTRGLRTLVVDLDPQANATVVLDPTHVEFTSNDVLADGRAGVLTQAITASGWGDQLDVVASERSLEHRAVPEGEGALRLRVTMQGLEHYDIVLLDTPPALGELTRNALAASDLALVVTEPSLFALQGASQAVEAVEVMRAFNLRLALAGIVVNRVRPALGRAPVPPRRARPRIRRTAAAAGASRPQRDAAGRRCLHAGAAVAHERRSRGVADPRRLPRQGLGNTD